MSSVVNGFHTSPSLPQPASKQQVESAGLKAEQALEKDKGHIKTDDKDAMQKMEQSWQGYKASHPTASLDDFAKQEAGKVGLSSDDVEKMVNAVATQKG